MYVSQGIHGIAYGMVLFLVSSGVTLIIGMMNILNMAHAAFFMLSAYFCYQVVAMTGSFWLGLLVAPVITAFSRIAGRRPLYTSVAMRALCGNRSISHQKASWELDYRPRPIRETLVDTLRWFEETGQLARPLKLPSAGSS